MKRLISLMAATALLLSSMLPATAYALDDTTSQAAVVQTAENSQQSMPEQPDEEQVVVDTPTSDQQTLQNVADAFAALPSAAAVQDMSDEELQAALDEASKAYEAFDALTDEQTAQFQAQYPELYTAAEELFTTLAEKTNGDIDTTSLRPIEEVQDVYITLMNVTQEELANYSIDDFLAHMTDKKGNPVELPAGATTAWFHNSRLDHDEFFQLNNGETTDLCEYSSTSNYAYGSSSYEMTVVVGNGKQMEDAVNKRYKIQVEYVLSTNTRMYMNLGLNVRQGQDAFLYKLAANQKNRLKDTLHMPGISYTLYTSDALQDAYTLCAYNNEIEQLDRKGYTVNVYPVRNFMDYLENDVELTGAVTDKVFVDSIYSGEGLAVDFRSEVTAENCKDAPNAFVIAISNKTTGQLVGYYSVDIQIVHMDETFEAALWKMQDGSFNKKTNGTFFSSYYGGSVYLDRSQTGNQVYEEWSFDNINCGISAGVKQEEDDGEPYYLTIKPNSLIKKIYLGSYANEAAAVAAGAEDVTATLLYNSDAQGVQGYKNNFSEYKYFTIILADGNAANFAAHVYTMGTGTPDTSFSINSIYKKNANGGQGSVDSYNATTVGDIALDTYYRVDDTYDVGGYQLVMLNGEYTEDDLKNLIPYYNVTKGTEVSSGGKMESGVTDLSNAQWSTTMPDTVLYQVQVPGEKVKNYQVTFASKQIGSAKLLVAGPDERFVNLTADNDYVHDIVVANMGNQELTGIKVELIDPVNVKLDSYWTLGGTGNDSIPAFENFNTYYTDKDGGQHYNNYATPGNIAKIRLLPDGSGTISGTLRITTANGGSRDIKLTGIAANPGIVTTELTDAVKYVPYSQMIVTDNMYKWNHTTFKIVDGKLPNGLKLYEKTGEIYGVPQETGSFTFTVQVDYSSSRFTSSQQELTLVVKDNTNTNVYNETDMGYSIKQFIGVEQGAGTRDYYLADASTDQLYVSEGEMYEFVGLWLNGEKLTMGQDYTAVRGSTRITIKSQTFANKAKNDGYNTLAAEFRVGGSTNNELKRTAQNFRLGKITSADGDKKDDDKKDESGKNNNTNNGNSGTTGDNTNNGGNTTNGSVTNGGSTANAGTAGNASQSTTNNGSDGVAVDPNHNTSLLVYVKDANGSPAKNVTVELHSKPRVAITGEEGSVLFENVPFGSHTLYVKSRDGTVIASKAFALNESGTASLNGSTLNAINQGTVTLNVQYSNGTITFMSASGQPGSAIIPQTQDTFPLTVVVVIICLSGVALVGLLVFKKKRSL